MASMSKRAQARTEKELHDLLKTPGNSSCADCGARNPAWASWNLGVFLCIRCASLHRKLGTHISKVKSLSMDTWSSDQVESMKKNGNLAVNKLYNPKNKKPDMPLDADEVDGAMERFIRKKYQEKSLSDGRPEVPRHDEVLPPRSKSPDISPPPIQPSKKSRFFGFGLRASSSAYPLSKHDKKHRNEPRVDSTFRIASDNYSGRTSDSRADMSDYDLQVKLSQLRDMGFTDNDRNTNMLKRHNGDLERTIASLVKLGPSEQPTARKTSPVPGISTSAANTTSIAQTSASAPQSATTSLNPFNQPSQSNSVGISVNTAVPQQMGPNANPWQSAMSAQPATGLEQSFSNMQVSQPLFPHSTGGYPGQPQYGTQQVQQTIYQQYPMTGSPVNMHNPFMQTPMSAHSTGSNPYMSQAQNMPSFAPSTNPFMSMPMNSPGQQANATSQSFNPFGLPPSASPPPTQHPQSSVYDAQSAYGQPAVQSPQYGGSMFGAQQQFMQSNGPQSPTALPNFQYGQAHANQQQQQQQQLSPSFQHQQNPFFQQQQQQQQQQQPQSPQQSSPNMQSQHNPYAQQAIQQPQQQQNFQQQQSNQPLVPQVTGHMNKQSILALYNYPQLAPPKPLASVPESADDQSQSQTPQQTTSPAPSNNIYGGANSINQNKRSATMPVSTMHSAGGGGSRNPFMGSANSSGSSTPAVAGQSPFAYSQGTRHASHDSMIVNNQGLQEGRHSPDAFASLSARYVR